MLLVPRDRLGQVQLCCPPALQTQECDNLMRVVQCVYRSVSQLRLIATPYPAVQTQECENLMRVVRELADGRSKLVATKASLQVRPGIPRAEGWVLGLRV